MGGLNADDLPQSAAVGQDIPDRPQPRSVMARIESDFTYHPPKEGQVDRYEALRAQARDLARAIVDDTPAGREQALALTNLEQAMFWANAAIARNE